MRCGIIGAGISGLAVAQLLKNDYEIEILEKDSLIGGIAKTRRVGDIPYHLVGGHCFNSKDIEVLKYVFNNIMPKTQWRKIERNSKIYFKNHFIDYPIEFSIKQISGFDPDMSFKMTRDFFRASREMGNNLEDWFRNNFGDTLSNEYFIPYNKKIWNSELSKMSSEWIKGKLPLPDEKKFFQALIGKVKDDMPHVYFYYSKSNDQADFIRAIARDLKITTNYKVTKIEKSRSRWVINGEKRFDIIITTMPLKELPFVVASTPDKIKKQAEKLKYNKTTTMLWETEPINNTWTYYPSSETIFHRHIHIGNFLFPKRNYTITESMGEKNYEVMTASGREILYLKKPLDYNISDYAYIVFDNNYSKSVSTIKKYLNEIDIYTLGRFGEWKYYNMDDCIRSAMDLAEKLRKKAINK
jgi:protoporphyrinogen oxidase